MGIVPDEANDEHSKGTLRNKTISAPHGKLSKPTRILASSWGSTALVETTASNTIPAARLFSFAHSALKASTWVCCSTSLVKKRGASLVAAQLFTNPLWRRSARSKEPEKGFAAMEASALQRTPTMKANLASHQMCSFEHPCLKPKLLLWDSLRSVCGVQGAR